MCPLRLEFVGVILLRNSTEFSEMRKRNSMYILHLIGTEFPKFPGIVCGWLKSAFRGRIIGPIDVQLRRQRPKPSRHCESSCES